MVGCGTRCGGWLWWGAAVYERLAVMAFGGRFGMVAFKCRGLDVLAFLKARRWRYI